MHPSTRQIVWLAFGMFCLVMALRDLSIPHTDFRTFYDSALAWRSGANIYETGTRYPTLSPPTLAVLVAPFTFFGLVPAFLVWTGLGAAALVASLTLLHRESELRGSQTWWVVGALGVLVPAQAVWVHGQLTWLLLYPATRAYVARSPIKAGFWLAPVIVIKPQLGVWALFLPWHTAAAATTGALGISMLSLIATGLHPWLTWWRLKDHVDWLGFPLNASWFGLASRAAANPILAGPTVQQLNVWWWIGAALLAAGCWLGARRVALTERWVLGLFTAVLLGPLGWSLYLPLALGPIAATWKTTALSVSGALLLSVPQDLMWQFTTWQPGPSRLVALSTGFFGLACWIVEWLQRRGSETGCVGPMRVSSSR